jgi:hypothetical protein
MLAIPLISLFFLAGVHGINITTYADPDCRGLNAIRHFYAIPEDGCFVRGMEESLRELEGESVRVEVAVATQIDDVRSQSEFIAFFTSDDCDPDNIIEDAYLERGCVKEKARDYKSWAVWDTCEGDEWCSLES